MASTIFHISDLHITPASYTNIDYAFKELVREITSVNDYRESCVLVICGDIFDKKSNVRDSDIDCFNRIIRTLNIFDIQTVIIPGNHDMNLNTQDLSDGDMVSLLLQLAAQQDNTPYKVFGSVICLPRSQVLDKFGLRFYHFGICDPPPLEMPLTETTTPRIALLHEPINGAKFQDSIMVSRSRYSVADLAANFDLVLLGDIHQTQFLTPNMAYCGSFVQCAKNEPIQRGYIRWSRSGPREFQGTFHPLPQKEVYLVLEAQHNQVELPALHPISTVRYLQVNYSFCSPEFLTELRQRLMDTYHRPIDVMKCKSKDVAVCPTDQDYRSIDTQETLIRDLLKAYSQDQIDDIVLMHHERSLNRKPKLTQVTKWRLQYLCFSNLYCFGEKNTLVFDEMKGLVSICGANATGKSSVIDILTLALFNENTKGKKEDCINIRSTWAELKCGFRIGQDEYVIERRFERRSDRGTLRQSIRLLKNATDITLESVTKTYERMSKELGLGTFDDFVDLSLALQNRQFLVDCKESTKQKVLSRIIDLEEMEGMFKEADEERRLNERNMRELRQDLTKHAKDDAPKFFPGQEIPNYIGFYNQLRDLVADLELDAERAEQGLSRHNMEMERLQKEASGISSRYSMVHQQCLLGEDVEQMAAELAPFRDVTQPPPTIPEDKVQQKIHQLNSDLRECSAVLEMLSGYTAANHGLKLQSFNEYWARVYDLFAKFDAELPVAPPMAGVSLKERIASCLHLTEAMIERIEYTMVRSPEYTGPLNTVQLQLNAKETRARIQQCQADRRTPEVIQKELEARTAPRIENYLTQVQLSQYQAYLDIHNQIHQTTDTVDTLLTHWQALGGVAAEDPAPTTQMSLLPLPESYTHLSLAGLESEKEMVEQMVQAKQRERAIRLAALGAQLSEMEVDQPTNFADLWEVHYGAIQEKSNGIVRKEHKQLHQSWVDFLRSNWKMNASCECCQSNYAGISQRLTQMAVDFSEEAFEAVVAKERETGEQMQQYLANMDEIERKQSARERARHEYELAQQVDNDAQVQRLKYIGGVIDTIKDNLRFEQTAKCMIERLLVSWSEPLEQFSRDLRDWPMHEAEQKRLQAELEMALSPYTDLDSLLQQQEQEQRSIQWIEETRHALCNMLGKFMEDMVFHVKAILSQQLDAKQAALAHQETLARQWLDHRKKHQLDTLEAYLKVMAEIDQTKALLDDTLQQIKEEREKLVNARVLCDKLEEKIGHLKVLERENTKLTLYCKCIDVKTGIPHLAMQNLVSMLEQQCNQILDHIADFGVHLEIGSPDGIEAKRNKLLQITTYYHNGDEIHASLNSGSQKFILDLVLRVVLLQISHVSQPNFLVIDEGFGCLDEVHFNKVKNMLPKLLDYFDTLIVISHQQDLQSQFHQFVQIVHQGGISKTEFGVLQAVEVTTPPSSPMTNAGSDTDQMLDIIQDNLVESYTEIAKKCHIPYGRYKKTPNDYRNQCQDLYLSHLDKVRPLLTEHKDSHRTCTVCEKHFASEKKWADHYTSKTHMVKHVEAFVTLVSSRLLE